MIQGNAILPVGAIPPHARPRPRPILNDPGLDRTDAIKELLVAAPAEFLWGRQAPNPDQSPSSSGQPGTQSPGMWRDGLLAEIENLTEQLKHKILRFVMLRAAPCSGQPMLPDDEAALIWGQQALDDIAATARGIEIASHEVFLEAMTAQGRVFHGESSRKHDASSEE